MESNLQSAKDQLTRLSTMSEKYLLLNALNMLAKLLDNIVKNPLEEKYKKINCKNEKILSNLFNIAGIEICIENIGFTFDKKETAYFFRDPMYAKDLTEFLSFLNDTKDEVAGSKTKKEEEVEKLKEEYEKVRIKQEEEKKETEQRKEKAALKFESDRIANLEHHAKEKQRAIFRKEQEEIKKREHEELKEQVRKEIESKTNLEKMPIKQNEYESQENNQNHGYHRLSVFRELSDVQEFEDTIKSKKVTVILFVVPWCKNSLNLKEKIGLDNDFPDIDFCSVNIDAVSGISSVVNVSSTPTVKLYANSLELQNLEFASYEALVDLLKKYK